MISAEFREHSWTHSSFPHLAHRVGAVLQQLLIRFLALGELTTVVLHVNELLSLIYAVVMLGQTDK